jgi:hypothetical protein
VRGDDRGRGGGGAGVAGGHDDAIAAHVHVTHEEVGRGGESRGACWVGGCDVSVTSLALIPRRSLHACRAVDHAARERVGRSVG